MSENGNGLNFEANEALRKNLQEARTPDEIRDLLHAAVEQSPELGIARDPQTGQFVRRDTPPAAQVEHAEEEEQEHILTITLGGHELTFTGSMKDVEAAAENARIVFEATQPEPGEVAAREKTPDEIGRQVVERAEAELALRRGEITAAEYLEKTNAVQEFLAERGFDLDQAAGEQYERSWAEATQEFLNGPLGSDWPGGPKNLNIIGMKLQELGLTEATDKVAALGAAFEQMKKDGLVFSTEPTEEQLKAETANMTPQEILEHWKEAQGGDPEKANDAFVRIHSSTGSGLFGK